MSKLTNEQAIELAYGLLWLAPTIDRQTKAGDLVHRARTTLHGQLDLDGRKRGLSAAQDVLGPPSSTPHQIHNRDAGDIVKDIVRPTLEAGGQMTEVLVLLESVVVGVVMVAVKLGGDEIVLDKLVEGVKKRLAEERLGGIETKGKA